MSTLLSLLQEVDPTTSAAMAADLRAGLTAISQEGQRDSSSRRFSLNDWWRWLDDEGYNRDSFLAAFILLGRARVGDASWAPLLEACRSHGDQPDGLGFLLAQFDQLDPELSQDLHRLELLAISEENELHQIGAGTSARFKLAATIGAGALIYCLYQDKKGQKQMEQAVRTQLENKAAQYDRWMQELQRKGRVELRFAKNDTKQAAADVVKGVSEHPQQTLQRLAATNRIIVDNSKDIGSYTKQDVDDKVAMLVAEHTLAFIGKSAEKQAVIDLRANPEYQSRLAKAVDDVARTVRPGMSIDRQALSQKARAALEQGDWFQGEKAKILGSERYRDLWNTEVTRVKSAYRAMVQEEIRIARDEARYSESRFLEDRIKFVGDKIIHKSNVVITQDVVKLVADAEDFARAAERAAKQDSSVVIEELR